MRICIDKSGKLIEMQSDATEGTLIKNALNAGYKEDEIEEKVVTSEEWAVYKAELRKPTPEQIQENKIQIEMQRLLREQAIANLKEDPRFETKLTLSNPIKGDFQ